MHGITEQFFKSERDPAGRAADSAGQIHKQRVFGINAHSVRRKLSSQPQCGNCIAHEKIDRILVINKVARWVRIGEFPALPHSLGIVRLIFNNVNTLFAQQILFPLFCIRAHMNGNIIAECSACNAYAQPEVPR